MDYNDIKDLISTVIETDIMKIEVKYKDVEVKFDRNKDKFFENNKNEFKKEIFKKEEDENKKIDVLKKVSGNKVKSPIVGTFYEAASPTSKKFVEVGDKVKKGDILFIIEAMKVINEIKSDYNGTVIDILVKDGDLVEYNQVVMVIE